MFPSLLPELNEIILSYLTPREQARLCTLNSSVKNTICGSRNQKSLSAAYKLPYRGDSSSLRYLDHCLAILSDNKGIEYIFHSAIWYKDTNWLVTRGPILICDMNDVDRCSIEDDVLRCVIKNGCLDVYMANCPELSRERAAGRALVVASALGDLKTYKSILGTYGLQEHSPSYSVHTITSLAANGLEDMVNYLCPPSRDDSNYVRSQNHSRILAGYIIGGHLELYEKYKAIYQTEEVFARDDVSLAIERGNLDILRKLADSELCDDLRTPEMATLCRSTPINVIDIFDFLRPFVNEHELNRFLYPVMITSFGRKELLLRYLEQLNDTIYENSGELYADDIASEYVFDDQQRSECLRILLEYIYKHRMYTNFKQVLMNYAVRYANLELICALERL